MRTLLTFFFISLNLLSNQQAYSQEVPEAQRPRAYLQHHNTISPLMIKEWDSETIKLDDFFQKVKTTRLDNWLPIETGEISRLIPWFNEEACETRAELISRYAEHIGVHKLQKIFILNWSQFTYDWPLNKRFPQYNTAIWSYHVAPVTRVGDQILVIDPVLNSNKPIPFKEWFQTLEYPYFNVDVNELSLSLCDEQSWDGLSACLGGSGPSDDELYSRLKEYLDDEWKRIKDIAGFDPYSVLGDNHPFITNVYPQHN